MDKMGLEQVISQLRAMQSQAGAAPVAQQVGESNDTFGPHFKQALDNVNDMLMKSGQMQEAYEKGDPNVSLPEVMIQSQKASIAFQATLEVRNRFVEFYKDIMNMPI